MTRLIVLASILVVSGTVPLPPMPALAGNVSIGINIGTPLPPVPPAPPMVVVPAPPQLVVVPGTAVYYAPGVSFNYFVYGGQYFTFHDGSWFVATTYNGPWTFVALEQVPKPVLAVPVAYYKVPPGQMRRMSGPPSEPRGHDRGFCPPGLAKQGRC